MNTRFLNTIGVMLFAASLLPQASLAQPFPNRPVKIVVISAAGGAQDSLARMVADKLGDRLKQQVIVENRPGAGSRIAAEYVQQQPADGYTLLQNSTTFTYLPQYYPNAHLNPAVDFVAVAAISGLTSVLFTSAELPVKNLQELIAYLKSTNRPINWGVTQNGGFDHLVGADLVQRTGMPVTFIPYKGEVPQTLDFLAGRTQIQIGSMSSTGKHLATGKVRAIGVVSSTRLPEAPEIPTIAEQGVPGFSARVWFGLFAHARVPREIVVQLNRAVEDVKRDPEFVAKVKPLDQVVLDLDRDQFTTLVRDETARWGRIIRDLGFKPE